MLTQKRAPLDLKIRGNVFLKITWYDFYQFKEKKYGHQ